ncbi:hypothetical protein HQQ94_18690 [Shewanella sp. VB17]|uniref:hypothetical protein n=1 Tax=Shewanella sp. VB17 TaxID=2739432 RepID=UPI00156469DF|nr:hypothetical protein [Shewanella sp. VB17]NRD75212.1 hypothetical protein [Shewanella sp. VB17]
MRHEEEFALKALVSKYGGEFTEGEDPPDAYLLVNDQRIAVEVSMLVEHITKNGTTLTKMAEDVPVSKISKELEAAIGDYIPDEKWLYLGLPTPIKNIRKFRTELAQFALEVVRNNTESADRIISGNRVSINYYSNRLSPEKKVVQFVSGRQSFNKEQAAFILQDRIKNKDGKIAMHAGTSEYWLALVNTYWPANIETYREVYKSFQYEHKFNKILIIDNQKQVEVLC